MTENKRVLIVGGVAGGAAAAARARRLSEDAEIIIFERGEHVSFANCGLPYHIGGVITDRKRLLVQTPQSLNRRFGIDVRIRSEVLKIDRTNRELLVVDHATGREYLERYDALILSPGAAPVRPPIPGADSERVLALRNIEDMDAIIRLINDRSPKRAVVVGGGYIGLEMVEALRERGIDVTLVELADQLMGPFDPEMVSPLNNELKLRGVDLRLGTSVTEFTDADGGLELLLSNGDKVTCEMAIMAIGVRPEATLAKQAGLEVGTLGGIVVDQHMRTGDPMIYAVGDAVEVKDLVAGQPSLIPLAGPANRQGRIAADNIFGRETVYKDTQGTAICKVFNLAVAMTGASEKTLGKAGIPYEKIYVHPASHAGYYPGAHPVSLKLLFDPSAGKILGAQAVGADGVDKRIDVLATAVRAGLTVFDLEELELAYAPPYGSARDVINYAGFVAGNAIRGDVKLCHTADVVDPNENQKLLDVRTPDEVAAGTIPGAKNIPIDDLRGRLNDLRKDKEYLVFCQVGLRGYLACRILEQNGFRCRNLTGGYKTYMMSTGNLPQPAPVEQDMEDDADESVHVAPQPKPGETKIAMQIDATGLQCPGPIQRLRKGIDEINVGEAIRIKATDPGFASDVPAWCNTTGHRLLEIAVVADGYEATIAKCAPVAAGPCGAAVGGKKGLTIVVFSSDFDKVIAAFVISNGAAAMGYEVTLFFTFWGLNALRKDNPPQVEKTMIEKMFGWMMPCGANRLALSQMHMLGMGRAMIKGIMKQKNVTSLPDSIRQAQEAGVRLVACTMSMDLMGIKTEELIDGVEEGGVAMYLDRAGAGNVNLFI